MEHQIRQRDVTGTTGYPEVLREIEKHKDEAWTEEDFDIAMHDDRYRDRYEE